MTATVPSGSRGDRPARPIAVDRDLVGEVLRVVDVAGDREAHLDLAGRTGADHLGAVGGPGEVELDVRIGLVARGQGDLVAEGRDGQRGDREDEQDEARDRQNTHEPGGSGLLAWNLGGRHGVPLRPSSRVSGDAIAAPECADPGPWPGTQTTRG